MAKDKVRAPEESSGGAPKWMVTFSDCMTLLLTFFVLLLSFSSFDDKAFSKLSTSLATGKSSISAAPTRNRDSIMQRDEMQDHYQQDRNQGSESPTDNGKVNGLVKEDPEEFGFRNRKVFLTPSSMVFLGSGSTLSRDGRKLLSDLAMIFSTLPNKIVISENRLRGSSQNPNLGLTRAWTALTYLVVKGKLKRDRFAISGTSTVPLERLTSALKASPSGRVFEVVLLDKNICQ
jgi:chemotaxis protein MotB